MFQSSVAVPGSYGVSGVNGVTMLAPISGQSPGLTRAQVSHGVRQVGVSNLELTLDTSYFRSCSAKTRITRLASR